MSDDRMAYYSVTRYVSRCEVEGCDWRQEHGLRGDAEEDGERHLKEWHTSNEDDA